MEFMAVSSSPYDTDRFGAALPRFSPRQSDLLMVVGTLTHKQAPVLLKVYEQMCEPKWVMAFGACATSGGFYQNYAAVAGHRQDHSGRRLRARLPAAARDGDRRDHEAAGPDRALAPSDPHRTVLTMAATVARHAAAQLVPRRCGDVVARHARRRCWRRPSSLDDGAPPEGASFGFDLLLDVTAVDWPRAHAALRRRLSLLLDRALRRASA